ncbi:MAG: RHS repeat-associated core domain-containing protein [Euryarchaeota archaeon]|nr:RHS repeat-associated core domain-containing protein [Euryarchaeota archaeon]
MTIRVAAAHQQKDANTGLYYLYRRFYDPELGRFLSQDPILGHLTVPQSLDRFTYTVNNPLRYVDPDGGGLVEPVLVGRGPLGGPLRRRSRRRGPVGPPVLARQARHGDDDRRICP